MTRMFLIDGARYHDWTPTNEDQFKQIVEEHIPDIFGKESIYLDLKRKPKSEGLGSLPSVYVILYQNPPQWHIVQMKPSSHPSHHHVVSQASRFTLAISNPSTRTSIVEAMYDEITRDDFLKLNLQKAIGTIEIYKFLSELISQPPVLTIIIDLVTQQLSEAIHTLARSEVKVVEFQTFIREGTGLTVHAHLFEPVYQASANPVVPLHQ